MRIKTVLPLLTCLIHGQMRSPLALSSKERKGMFPKLKVQMERLLHYSDLEEIDKWYMDSLPQFTIIQTENEDNNVNSDALLKLLDNNDGAYTPTKVSSDFPIMAIEINIPNSFAELFYDAALRLETIRTLLWLKDEEKRLRNDESMLQVVRNTMTRLNEFVGLASDALPPCGGRFSVACPRTVLTRLRVYGSPSVTALCHLA